MTKATFLERNRGVVNRVIRGRLAKTGRVLHGSRAQNQQLPRDLQRKNVTDFDVFAKNPRKAARNMEKALDKKFGGDFFFTKAGATKELKVRKVVRKDGVAVVDFSIPDRVIQTITKRGIRMASLKDQRQKAIDTLNKESAEFRREKDLDLLRRINIFNKRRNVGI